MNGSRWSRRRWAQTLALSLSAAWGGYAWPQAPVAVRRGSVLQFGADPSGKLDSSSAFSEAIKQFELVEVPAGTYVLGNVVLRAGVTIAGVGDVSVLRQKAGSNYVLTCDSGSADTAANLRGIVLKDLQVRGSCDVDGFSEFIHLLSVNGVSDTVFDRVTFRGFRGDGLYLGSSNKANVERHNLRVTVRDCVFDGINRENRNGISVIDCDGLVVERCRFVNISRSNMPGAVDLEPNSSPFHLIRNVRITENTFKGIGGNLGAVALLIPASLTSMPSNIVIEGNLIDGTAAAGIALVQRVPPPRGSAPQGLVVRKNRVVGSNQRPFLLQGVVGVEIADNEFSDAAQAALIGYREPNTVVREVTLRRNLFRRCGNEGGVGVSVFNASGLIFLQNEWQDCGHGKPTAYAVDFNAGQSDRVIFSGNRFSAPTGKTQFAIQKEANHTFAADTNVFDIDNVIEGTLRNAFEAKGRRAP